MKRPLPTEISLHIKSISSTLSPYIFSLPPVCPLPRLILPLASLLTVILHPRLPSLPWRNSFLHLSTPAVDTYFLLTSLFPGDGRQGQHFPDLRRAYNTDLKKNIVSRVVCCRCTTLSFWCACDKTFFAHFCASRSFFHFRHLLLM